MFGDRTTAVAIDNAHQTAAALRVRRLKNASRDNFGMGTVLF